MTGVNLETHANTSTIGKNTSLRKSTIWKMFTLNRKAEIVKISTNKSVFPSYSYKIKTNLTKQKSEKIRLIDKRCTDNDWSNQRNVTSAWWLHPLPPPTWNMDFFFAKLILRIVRYRKDHQVNFQKDDFFG